MVMSGPYREPAPVDPHVRRARELADERDRLLIQLGLLPEAELRGKYVEILYTYEDGSGVDGEEAVTGLATCCVTSANILHCCASMECTVPTNAPSIALMFKECVPLIVAAPDEDEEEEEEYFSAKGAMSESDRSWLMLHEGALTISRATVRILRLALAPEPQPRI